jgi:tRNA-dihydrouridine synthase B
MVDLIAALRANPFLLAPMAGITDRPFRTFMRKMGCGVVITELVSANGIEYKNAKTERLMLFDEIQRPFGVQLFGEEPETVANAAKFAVEKGADFIDLNFGCPVPKVVKKGAGSAILKDLPRVEAMFRTVKAAINVPLTVKIRTGWDQDTRNAEKVAQIAFDEGLAWVAIHGRTRAQAYTGEADWNYIGTVKAKSKIPIIGNGDIHTADTAVRRMREAGVDGVMIGRGCLKNPWIFRESLAIYRKELGLGNANVDKAVATDIAPQEAGFLSQKNMVALLHELHGDFLRCTDEKITMLQIKKFASWYSSGYPGASNFRKAVFQTQSLTETFDLTCSYFATLDANQQSDTSAEAFLMGGHG